MGPNPVGMLMHAQAGIRRAAVRRHLQSVASGKATSLTIDSDPHGVDVAEVVEEITLRLGADSIEVQRLAVAFRNSGTADSFVERLGAKSFEQRASSARLIGALHMSEAVPWVARLLEQRDRKASDAAARALGRIGGGRSATALVKAIQHRGLNRRLVAELARSAPDLFLESALHEPQRPSVRPALAMAAGLRRRHAAVAPLIEVLQHGSRRERVISCRALGWIGSGSAIPVITAALQDRDWKTRMSAAKALGALRAASAKADLEFMQIDPNARVRAAARQALNRIHGGSRHGA